MKEEVEKVYSTAKKMKVNANTKLQKNNNIINLLIGTLTSIIITLVTLFIYALVLTKTNVSETTIYPVILIIIAISIFIGAIISCTKLKKFGMLNGGLIALMYISIVYTLSSVMYTGFNLNLKSTIIIVISIIIGSIGGVIGINVKKK